MHTTTLHIINQKKESKVPNNMDTNSLFFFMPVLHPNAQCYFYFTNLEGQFEDFRATVAYLNCI